MPHILQVQDCEIRDCTCSTRTKWHNIVEYAQICYVYKMQNNLSISESILNRTKSTSSYNYINQGFWWGMAELPGGENKTSKQKLRPVKIYVLNTINRLKSNLSQTDAVVENGDLVH